jgi:hypothetical protein
MLCSNILLTTNEFNPPHPRPPPCKNCLKFVCIVNIVYRNLMSENCQDYAQKPQTKLYVHEFGFWNAICVGGKAQLGIKRTKVFP